MTKAEQDALKKVMPQSLRGETVRPLCVNHKPAVKQLADGLIQISCPNCSYCATMSKETYQELQEGL